MVGSYFLSLSFINLSMFIKDLIERIRRVLLISSKPDKDEFRQSAKITGIGIALIGMIGFIIFLIVMLGCGSLKICL